MAVMKNSALAKLWERIGTYYAAKGHTHSKATASAPGYMSAEDKAKLDGIDPDASKTVVDAALSATSTNPVQNKAVKAALDAKANSSHSHAAYVNQNAFSHVSVGSTDIAADSSTDTLTFAAGSNVTLTPDASTDKVTIAATDTTYSAATASAAGLMSSTDKAKLDGVATGANNYSHPTSAGNKHVPAGGSSGQILRWSAAGTAAWGDDKDTTYSAMAGATSSAAGSSGLVPAPAAGAATRYLRSDGTWTVPPDTKYTHPAYHAATMVTEDSTHRFVTDAEKSTWNAKAATASPTFTGTPKAPTAAAGTNTTQIATTAFVRNEIAAAEMGHAINQGVATSNSVISGSAYKKGWYWVVGAAGTYVGQVCEVNDMVYANYDKGSSYKESDFSVVQNNLQAMTAAELDAILV